MEQKHIFQLTLTFDGYHKPVIYPLQDVKEIFHVRDNMSLSSNDNVNNIKAISDGNTTLEATFEGITGSINIEVLKNPVEKIKITSSSDQARTGDVIQFKAVAYNKKGQELSEIPFEYTYKGKSYDKSNTASGLVSKEGKFVGDVAGDYIITASLGNISSTKAINIYDRNIKRDVLQVGTGLVNDKHTSDFWVFEVCK